MEPQKRTNSQKVILRKNKVSGIMLPVFKLHYKPIVKQYVTGTKIDNRSM